MSKLPGPPHVNSKVLDDTKGSVAVYLTSNISYAGQPWKVFLAWENHILGQSVLYRLSAKLPDSNKIYEAGVSVPSDEGLPAFEYMIMQAADILLGKMAECVFSGESLK